MGEITQKTYNKAKIIGYSGSIGTGIILFLILFFTYIYTPIPPYPEGGGGGGMGLEVNLGFSEAGLGDLQQSQVTIPDFTQQTNPAPPAEVKPQEVLSQDFEETASISDAPKTKPKKTEPKVVSTVQTKKPKTEPVAEKPKVVNKTALYKPGSSTAATSEGNTQGSGDQGSPDGRQSSGLYGPGGSGGTGPGSGGGSVGGSGGGIGSGIGDGVGPGISFNLDGRSMILIREPQFNIQKEGIVVVEITVDQDGRVIAATPGVKGSTIVDNTLYAAARKAALESKFNVKSNAPERQIGKITYHFKLK